jgi:hypothetical protein
MIGEAQTRAPGDGCHHRRFRGGLIIRQRRQMALRLAATDSPSCNLLWPTDNSHNWISSMCFRLTPWHRNGVERIFMAVST